MRRMPWCWSDSLVPVPHLTPESPWGPSLCRQSLCPEPKGLTGVRLSIVAAAFLWTAAAASPPISIEFESGVFKVSGWTAPRTPPGSGWSSVFRVYAGAGEVPPLLGTYSVEGASLVFHPRFSLAAGVRYRAVFSVPGGAPVQRVFDGPR